MHKRGQETLDYTPEISLTIFNFLQWLYRANIEKQTGNVAKGIETGNDDNKQIFMQSLPVTAEKLESGLLSF